VVSDDSDRNFDGNGPRTGVVVTFQVGGVATSRLSVAQMYKYFSQFFGFTNLRDISLPESYMLSCSPAGLHGWYT
jgi:hypothetical protein